MNIPTQPEHKLFLSGQAEPDEGDAIAYTHFDQWPAEKWDAPRNIQTALEVLECWSKDLGIAAIDPHVMAAGKPWEEYYLEAKWGNDYPVVLIRAIEIILADGRYAVYGSDNFIEVYHLSTIRDSLLEDLEEDEVEDLIERANEITEKLASDPELIKQRILNEAQLLIRDARRNGFALTINAVSDVPLAMGNTHEEARVDLVRGKY